MINNYKKGSVVKSPIIPEGSNATHYDQYGVGGYREVETIRDLQYINKNYLTIGCLVYVNENKQIYNYLSSTNDYIINTLYTTNTITSLDLSKFNNTNTVLGVTNFGNILSKETNYIVCNVQSVLLKKEGNLYTLDKQYPIGGNT